MAASACWVPVEADEAPSDAARLQAKAEKWIEVRQLISRENSGWREQKSTWEALNEIRKTEIEKLTEFAETAEERVEELLSEEDAHAEERSELRSWRGDAAGRVARLEASLRPLLSRFPEPLRNSVEEPLTRIEAADPDRALQDRTRDLVLVLQAYREFQQSITLDRDVREIDGKAREVEVLYLGMTRAYFVDASGRHGGFGFPSSEGWIWEEDDSIAPEVRRAIAMKDNEVAPGFVRLPIIPTGEVEQP